MTPVLSIVMAAFDNADEVLWTLTNLRNEITGRGLARDVELLLVNNNPDSAQGKRIAAVCEKTITKHIPYGQNVGTSGSREHAIRSAGGEWVCCIDSHVSLCFDVLPKLLTFCRNNLSDHLYHGPLLSERFYRDDGSPDVVWTHWTPAWGSNAMLGKQAGMPPEKLASDDAIPIFGAGLGLFFVRRQSWLGFHPAFREFGGEEGYIHQKYRLAGRQVLLLPWLRWWHKFRDPSEPATYPQHWAARCWNYLCSFKETQFPALSGIRAMFLDRDLLRDGPQVATKRTSLEIWNLLLKEIGIDEAEAYKLEADGKIPRLMIEQPDGKMVLPPLPGPPVPPEGPGVELEIINREYFGIESAPDCDCKGKILQMNAWGVAGCRANYWTIVGWMKDGAQRFGWQSQLSAASQAILTGFAFRIKWSDPWPGIITEAVNRAEAKQKARADS